MSNPLEYKDTVQLVTYTLSTDGYANKVVDEVEDVPALWLANTGWSHGGNQTAIIGDAQVYLDPTNEFVIAHFNRLEGMLIIANPFGEAEEEAWYLIQSVIVGQDKLLGNTIDNIQCTLKKTTGIDYVS